jgi:hypothetical protein
VVSRSSGGNLKYLLAILLLLPSTAFASCKYDIFNKLSEKNKVAIHCDYNYDIYFDLYLRSGCPNIRGNNPQFSNQQKMANIIQKFLDAYPRAVLGQNLSDIFLLSNFYCGSLNYGGTCSHKSIYVEIYEYTTEKWLLEALHHEFSSALWRQNKGLLSKTKLESISGSESYSNSIINECYTVEDCRKENPRLLQEGFLCLYGKTNVENDLNIYAEYLFTKQEHLIELAKKYPLVDKKMKLLKSFYNDIGVPI